MFPRGADGLVVASGPITTSPSGDSNLPIKVRNNTSKPLSHIEITGSARTPAGTLIANGNSQGTQPATLKPGEVALAFIYFRAGAKAPAAGLKFTFTAQGIPPDTTSYASADLTVTEAEHSGQSIVGTAQNTTGKSLQGPYSVNVYCFTPAGKFLTEHGSFGSPDGPLRPNGRVAFTVDLFDAHCPTYLAGSTAYYS